MKRLMIGIVCIALGTELDAQSRHQKRPAKFFAAGDTIKAMTVLNQKIAKHTDDADLYLYRGKIKLERNDLSAAMADFNTFCILNSTCGEAGYLKSWILYQQGNYKGAIEQLSDYTRKQPSANAFLYLGLSHLRMNNYNPAFGAFERSVELESTNYNAVYNAGLAAYKADNASMAVSYFEKATHLLPSDFDAWFGLGLALNATQSFGESNKALRQALAVSPDNSGALFNIGLNYYELGNKKQACSYWGKAQNAGSLPATLSLERHCPEKEAKAH